MIFLIYFAAPLALLGDKTGDLHPCNFSAPIPTTRGIVDEYHETSSPYKLGVEKRELGHSFSDYGNGIFRNLLKSIGLF